MKARYLTILFILFLNSNSNHANHLNSNLQSQINLLINQLHSEYGFNGAIALQLNNQTRFVSAIGVQQPGVTLTTEHLFSTGSVGKEFTTVAILRLAEDKKLRLDDKISTFIPSLPIWGQRITINHLLTHTSGLPKIKWQQNITTEEVMAQVMALDTLNFAPGTQYLYGNINVMLRAKVVEAVTGDTFANYLKVHFFEPFNMTNTLQTTNLAKIKRKVKGDYPTAINGVTIYSTAADLLNWELALFDGRALNGRLIFQYLTQHPLSGKTNHVEYDFGQFFVRKQKVGAVMHDGSNPSHHVLKYTDLNQDVSFVVMSSDGNKQTLYLFRDKILDLVE